MIIKCKMCGGDIEFVPGATYGTCEYCGSTSTIPKSDDEGKLNRYNRANHFRRQGEFDKALAAYEKILEQDDADAEAHWGAAISRYGIEYVEDPATGRRIPTCHRLQLTSILADEDYRAAVEHAPDAESRRLYEEEAARIAEIQKGILAISQNEKPYDVFICYKETDASGQRTHDSQWAQEVYYGLTEQGYKVFFSRITLEDKLGQEYEPYIFAALQSARVMVVIGSKPEYFNAVWVKNEWSRYLVLMAHDRKRLLIPCYRDMDPYDLPDELSSLQSQDMSKIGFMQDLIRGVRKVLDAEKKPEPTRVVQQPVQSAAAAFGTPGAVSLMKRARLFMEDGDFKSASEYIDRVLDLDPEYAEAYAAKVCAAFGIRTEAGLGETSFLYEDNPDWQKALRFADPQQKAVYEGYAAKARKNVEEQIRRYACDCAVEMAVNVNAKRANLDAELAEYRALCARSAGSGNAGTRRRDAVQYEEAFRKAVAANEPGTSEDWRWKAAAEMFEALGDDDASIRAKQCRTLAEQARQRAVYQKAAAMYGDARYSSPTRLEKAAAMYLSVPDYKDAKAQAQTCLNEAESIRSKLYVDAVRAMNTAGNASVKWFEARKLLGDEKLTGYRDVDELRAKAEKTCDECVAAEKEARRADEKRRMELAAAAKRKRSRNIALAVVAVAIVIVATIVLTQVIIPGNKYRDAAALQQAGQYEKAITAFSELGDYRDAAVQVNVTKYLRAKAVQQAGNYNEAIVYFTELNGFRDSAAQIVSCLNSIKERDYQSAVALQQAGEYEKAIKAFEALNGYSDSAAQIVSCQNSIKERDYQSAIALQQAGEYEKAIKAFEALNGYSDSAAQIVSCQNSIKERDYQSAIALQQAGEYEKAIEAFTALGSYSDAPAQITETRYLKAKNLTSKGDYTEAVTVFIGIKGYKDVDNLLATDQNLVAAAAARLAPYKTIGSYVEFGHYPQTKSKDDNTPIEWLVLDYDAANNRALLISRYGLDAKPYNEKYVDITWEKCTLRTWLNQDFLNAAFSQAEQSAILLTNVDNSKSQGYSGWNTKGGYNTQDKIFLLSYAEANKYLGVTYDYIKNMKSRVAPTAYAIKNGAWTSSDYKTSDGSAAGWWWLRSPGDGQDGAAGVGAAGSLNDLYVSDGRGVVRPAFWLNLESGIF